LGTDRLGCRRFKYVAGHRISTPWENKRLKQGAFALLDGASEAGCTAFDTARAYPDSERTLGAWLRSRRLRERVVVISKGGHPGRRWESRLSAKEISADLERSLRTLRTDYIDVYLIHYDDDATPVEPIVDVLNRHVSVGKIRCIGVSNWATKRIAAAIRHARETGQKPFTVSSVQFSLASWRQAPWLSARTLSGGEAEEDRRWYDENSLWILAYSSLAMGFFSHARPYASGELNGSEPKRLGDQIFLTADNLARLKRTKEMAHALGVSVGQVALAWVLRYRPKVLAIVGAQSAAAYADAAAACDLELSESRRDWLYRGA
jgi:aryl-alcohol dehydrogenase-like predicted oxidoreductase